MEEAKRVWDCIALFSAHNYNMLVIMEVQRYYAVFLHKKSLLILWLRVFNNVWVSIFGSNPIHSILFFYQGLLIYGGVCRDYYRLLNSSNNNSHNYSLLSPANMSLSLLLCTLAVILPASSSVGYYTSTILVFKLFIE